IFLAEAKDRVISSRGLDPSFGDFLSLHGIDVPQVIRIQSQMTDPSWWSDFESFWKLSQGELNEFLFAGFSVIEEKIAKICNLRFDSASGSLIEAQRHWNDKLTLFQIAQDLKMPFLLTAPLPP